MASHKSWMTKYIYEAWRVLDFHRESFPIMKLSLSNFSVPQALENTLSKYVLLLNRGRGTG